MLQDDFYQPFAELGLVDGFEAAAASIRPTWGSGIWISSYKRQRSVKPAIKRWAKPRLTLK